MLRDLAKALQALMQFTPKLQAIFLTRILVDQPPRQMARLDLVSMSHEVEFRWLGLKKSALLCCVSVEERK